MTTQSRDTKSMLRGMATFETEMIESMLRVQLENQIESGLDPKTYCLAKFAALVAMDASPVSYAWQIGYARQNGVTDSDLTGVLVALAPTVGLARIAEAATEMAAVLEATSGNGNTGGTN